LTRHQRTESRNFGFSRGRPLICLFSALSFDLSALSFDLGPLAFGFSPLVFSLSPLALLCVR
jgi:hypothetical protein